MTNFETRKKKMKVNLIENYRNRIASSSVVFTSLEMTEIEFVNARHDR